MFTEIRVCRICGERFDVKDAAIWRVNGKKICPMCGTRQALMAIGINDSRVLNSIIDELRGEENE